MSVNPLDILDFWFETIPAQKRYQADPALDKLIRERFLGAWKLGREGALGAWEESASGALALIILLDQFPRNMFRGEGEAFSSDERAVEVAKRAVARGFDLAVEAERQMFFYMPYMYAETLADQDECVRLCARRSGEEPSSDSYAVRHRDAIARFGRFPARNLALGRASTTEEVAFLKEKPSGF